MDKRIKNKLRLVTFFVLLCLLIVPSHPVYAYFSDAISEDTGINLTLGSVDLSVENDVNNETTTGHTLKSENNKVDLKSLIKNNGTLSGKLAYKINLTKADGTSISNDLLQSINLKINDEDAKINNQYNLVSNVDSNALILDPAESKDFLIQMEVTDFSNQNESIKMHVEFLLFQTNGTIEKPLFHDQEAVSYAFEIEKEEVVTPPKEENEEYWPTNGWKDKGNIRYNLEDYSPIMYFSEIAGTTKIKNLNDIIIYIEVKAPEGVDLDELSISSPEDMSIEVHHVNENKRQLKVTFSINKNKFKRQVLFDPIDKYSIAAWRVKNTFDFNYQNAPISVKRILLSTDEAGNRNFSPRPINLFGETREIHFAQTNQHNTPWLSEPLENISFDDKVEVSVKIEGNNKNLVQIGEDATGNAQFTLQPTQLTEEMMSGPQLSVLLTGTSGETIEIKRNIQFLPTNSEVYWPEKMDTTWVTRDLEGNFTTSQASAKLVVNNGKYSSENMFIYIKNSYKEALQFSLTKPTTFPVQIIEYSGSGDYMRVVFNYNGSNATIPPYSNSISDGFTFTVEREIGGSLIYSKYLTVELFP
ncbi:hypothetical protein [Desemzia sp. FAM 23989]|uniref:hypothetical protein n=1 Tax=Desemzia sp. FAM 23989 TaxID=3259523 RepID=UPI003888A9FA